MLGRRVESFDECARRKCPLPPSVSISSKLAIPVTIFAHFLNARCFGSIHNASYTVMNNGKPVNGGYKRQWKEKLRIAAH